MRMSQSTHFTTTCWTGSVGIVRSSSEPSFTLSSSSESKYSSRVVVVGGRGCLSSQSIAAHAKQKCCLHLGQVTHSNVSVSHLGQLGMLCVSQPGEIESRVAGTRE